jgi:hypothetical protein
MELGATEGPDEGSMAITYRCSECGHSIAMVTNPGETQLVSSLGVQIGHERLPHEPMSLLRGGLAEQVPVEHADWQPAWTEAAERRLAATPSFVQPMVRRLYSDWARQQGIREITPQVMNQARESLGMESM